VILVSKDVNLRMKAKAVGMTAQNYTKDHVKDISTLYTGIRVEENIPEAHINQIYQPPYEIDPAVLNALKPFLPNEYMILKNGKKSALGTYDQTIYVCQ